MKAQRTWFAADKTGFHMLHTLFQTCLKYETIERYDEYFVTKLLVDEGRCQGVVAIELGTGQGRGHHRQCRDPLHGRLREGLPVHHQRGHQERGRDGPGLRRGSALKDMEFVQYHPTGLPFTGILDHGGRARRGRLAPQQGRLPLPPGLRPGEARAQAGAALHGARAPGPALPGLREGAGEGRTLEGPYGALRPPGRPAPGREAHRQEAPLRAGAVPQVREHRSREGDDPGPSRRPLHDGRRLHGHRGGDAPARPVRRGRGGLREHQRSQPPGLQLAARAPGLRGAGGQGGRRLRGPGGGSSRPSSWRPTTRRAGSRPSCAGAAGRSASPPFARRCIAPWRRAPASTAARPPCRSGGEAPGAAGAGGGALARRPQLHLQHGADHGQHGGLLQGRGQLGVEGVAVVIQRESADPLLQLL